MQQKRFVTWVVAAAGALATMGGCVIDGTWGPQFKYERTVELQQVLAPGTTLTAKTASGSIDATGTATDRAQVVATIIARAGSEEEAQELAEKVDIHFEEAPGKVALKADKPALISPRSISISYKMDLPRATNLECSSASGSIAARDLDGRVNAHTASGSVEAARIKGGVRLGSSSGSARAEQIESGDVRLDSASGSVRLANASGLGTCDLHTASGSAAAREVKAGTIKMSSASGPVTLADAQAESIDLHSGSGSVKAEAIQCTRLKAEAVSSGVSVAFVPTAPADVVADLGSGSGSINVALPQGFAGRVDLSTASGSVNVDLPVTVRGKLGRRHITGSIGEGAGRLSAHTASGSIRVR
jgi:DUF4097 and DUF4098 domain-containing protein YvlB